jgi:hypothetical protein
MARSEFPAQIISHHGYMPWEKTTVGMNCDALHYGPLAKA